MSAEHVNNGLPEPTNTPPMPQLPPAFAITMNALQAIANERARQLGVEGYSREHDDDHFAGELAAAATCYVMNAAIHLTGADLPVDLGRWWPWNTGSFKPKDPRRDLVRAAALIVAEIERGDRAAGK